MNEERVIASSLGTASETVLGDDSNLVILTVPLVSGKFVCKDVLSIVAVKTLASQVHGPLELEKIEVKFWAKTPGQAVAFMVGMSGMSVSDEMDLMAYPNAFGEVSTKLTCSKMVTYSATVPANLAKQLNPPSGDYPPPCLYVSMNGADALGSVHIYIRKKGLMLIKSAGF